MEAREAWGRALTLQALRTALSEDMTDEELAGRLEQVMAGLTPQEQENFLKGLGKFAQGALPGVVSGATTGATMGGPWGALIGGLAGGALSGVTSLTQKRANRPRKRPPRSTQKVADPPGRGSKKPHSGSTRGGQPAAQLMALLQNPAVMQALTSLVMGAKGRGTVKAGGEEVPVGAVLNALAHATTLAKRSSVVLEAQADDRYLKRGEGHNKVDPTDDTARAEHVLMLLGRGSATERVGAPVALRRMANATTEDWERERFESWLSHTQHEVLHAEVFE